VAFDGEMAEIAASFAAHDPPTGFGEAAPDIFGRVADFRGIDDATLGSQEMNGCVEPGMGTGTWFELPSRGDGRLRHLWRGRQ